MRQTETIATPYEVALTREDGRIVEVTIRAVGDAELDHRALSQACRTIMESVRREEIHRHSRARDGEARQSQAQAPEGTPLAVMHREFEQANGRMADRYLAALALAYQHVVQEMPGRAVIPVLAEAVGRPAATVKRHVMFARDKGFLTDAQQGRTEGEATQQAEDVLR